MLEQLPAIVYIWRVSRAGEIVSTEYLGRRVEETLGFGVREWIENSGLWFERVHSEDRDDVLEETRRSLRDGEPFALEYRMLARDDAVVWLHDVAWVLSRDEDGWPTRYQGVRLDITLLKQAEHARRSSVTRLRALDRQRRQLLSRLVSSQDEERRRIAEGIRGDTMQTLHVALTQLRAVAREHPILERDGTFARAREEISETITRLRGLAFELHPRVLDTRGLIGALGLYVETWTGTPAPSGYVLEDRLSSELSPATSSAVYRISQEALSNVALHSGASRVKISLDERRGGVLVRITDDGHGFDVKRALESGRRTIGLISMRERAEAIGGWMRIESELGVGTTVEFWLPLATDVDGEARPDKETDEERRTMPDVLSAREGEVAELLALGQTNAEIASTLHISVRTVEHHRSHVFSKLGVRSRSALVRRLREQR